MDPILSNRYEALIKAYNPPEQYAWIKELVITKSHDHWRPVRPDAVFFLIVNLTEMIVLPYAGHLPSFGESIEGYQNLSVDKIRPSVVEALDLIFSDLQLRKLDEISSHQVLRAIDATWPQLTVLFGWG